MVRASSFFTICTAVIGFVAAAPATIPQDAVDQDFEALGKFAPATIPQDAVDQDLEARGKFAPANVYYQACLDVTGNTCDSHGPALVGHCIEMDKRKYGFLEVENDTKRNCVVYHSPHHQCGIYYPKERLREVRLPAGQRISVVAQIFSFKVLCS